MSKERELIERVDPRDAIRKHQETADWPYRDEAAFWYGISQEMDKRFFNGFVYSDCKKVPAPFIAFDDLAIKIPLPAITFFLMNTESSEKLPRIHPLVATNWAR
jgi:hypothetical protein